jgi:hypothetical protein
MSWALPGLLQTSSASSLSAIPLSRSVRPEHSKLGPPSEGFPSNAAVPGFVPGRLS